MNKTISRWLVALTISLSLAPAASAKSLFQAFEPVEVIVKVKQGSRINRVLRGLDGLVLDEIEGEDLYLVSLPFMPRLLPGGIEYIEENIAVSLPVSPEGIVLEAVGDPSTEWYAHQPAFQVIRAPQARNTSTGLGVIVASIDSRVDAEHVALQSRLVPGYDFVEGDGSGELNQSSTSFMFEDDDGLYQSSTSFMFEDDDGLFQSSTSFMFEDDGLFQSSTSFMFEDDGLFQSSTSFMFEDVKLLQSSTSFMFGGPGYTHGTFTAGVIAAIAPDAQVMPLRAFNDAGSSTTFALTKAVHYAVNQGAHVINMSWGLSEDAQSLRDAIKRAARAGIVLVAAAGNSNTDQRFFPAAYSSVMAVASTDNNDTKASFSNFGKHISVSAPGQDIFSTLPDGLYGVKSGTSFSAPMVAGQAALLISAGARKVEKSIERTAKDLKQKNRDYQNELGSGRINLNKSLRKAR